MTIAEHLTFEFDGTFQGAYRDIPIRPGEVVTSIEVSEGGVLYESGAPTALGSTGNPGSFGVENLGSRIRIVWHYRATDESRTFTVSYRMRGLVVAYDDVVDVNLKVWGDEWEFSLDHLEAETIVPDGAVTGDVLVWGHAATSDGSTSLGVDGVSPTLEASSVPARQFVEFRVVFPRDLLRSTAGATVVDGPGLDGILAEEAALEVRDADAAEAADRFRHERNVTLLTLLLFVLPIPVALGWGFVRYGKEPRVEYDQEYEHSMPTGHRPAVVGALVSQGAADEAEFTATLFVTGSRTETLPVAMYNYVREFVDPTMAAISTIFIVLTALLLIVADRFLGLGRVLAIEEGR